MDYCYCLIRTNVLELTRKFSLFSRSVKIHWILRIRYLSVNNWKLLWRIYWHNRAIIFKLLNQHVKILSKFQQRMLCMVPFNLTSFAHIKCFTDCALKSRTSDGLFMTDATFDTFMDKVIDYSFKFCCEHVVLNCEQIKFFLKFFQLWRMFFAKALVLHFKIFQKFLLFYNFFLCLCNLRSKIISFIIWRINWKFTIEQLLQIMIFFLFLFKLLFKIFLWSFELLSCLFNFIFICLVKLLYFFQISFLIFLLHWRFIGRFIKFYFIFIRIWLYFGFLLTH